MFGKESLSASVNSLRGTVTGVFSIVFYFFYRIHECIDSQRNCENGGRALASLLYHLQFFPS